MDVFLDSDVIISSLLSVSGAAYALIHRRDVRAIISSFSVRELSVVVGRLGIDQRKFDELLRRHLVVIKTTTDLPRRREEFGVYVTDPNDAYVVAGARQTGVRFLISYNHKHFRIEKVRDELGILVLTPAQFLQYLRSRPIGITFLS